MADYAAAFETWWSLPWQALNQLPQVHARCWFVGESLATMRVVRKGSVFMRANHRRRPSTTWDPLKKPLRANQPLATGSEITFDYRLEIGPDWLKHQPPVWA